MIALMNNYYNIANLVTGNLISEVKKNVLSGILEYIQYSCLIKKMKQEEKSNFTINLSNFFAYEKTGFTKTQSLQKGVAGIISLIIPDLSTLVR
jgi:hypothetical protein